VSKQINHLFKFLLCNCRSLIPKYNELCAFSSTSNCQAMFLTETWLSDQVKDSIVNIPNYTIYRNDRKERRGGGVCIYIHNNYMHSELVDCGRPRDIEAKWVKIDKFIFCLIYIPPRVQFTLQEEITDYVISNFDKFSNESPDYLNILLGDFNQFNVDAISSHLSLSNVVVEATRGDAVLDKVFVAESDLEVLTAVLDPLQNSDHNKVVVSFKIQISKVFKFQEIYDFRHSNLSNFVQTLKNTDLSPILFADTPDSKLDLFYNFVSNCLEKIPKRKIRATNNDKKWITPVLKALINQRWNAYRSRNFQKYEALKLKVKREISRSKKAYFSKLLSSRSKSMWAILRDTNGQTKSKFDFKGTDIELASTINDNLRAIVTDNCKSYNINAENPSIDHFYFLEQEVQDIVTGINTKKASSDLIPNKIIVLLGYVFPQYITHIFNSVIETQTWPQRWKNADVIPLPKDKIPNYNNIRPISILSTLSKCLEKLFKDKLMPYYIKSIDSSQHGFIPMGSTSSALIALVNQILVHLDQRNTYGVSIISFDIKKAFDKVKHQLLLDKLCKFLPTNYVILLSSYLRGRKQRVTINSSFSSYLDVDSGVPQGSVLSPLLFGLYISDLTSTTSSFCFKYADDTTFIIPHYNHDITADIQTTFTHMTNWCSSNKLELNFNKTCLMTIEKRPLQFKEFSSLQQKPEIKILGVTINNKLKWDQHINNTTKSAASSLYLLRKCRDIFNKKQLIILYNSYVLSRLSYACPIFINLPQKLTKSFQRICNRAHYIICGEKCTGDCLIQPLQQKQTISYNLFKKALSNKSHPLHNIIPVRLLYTKKLCSPICRSDRYQRSFIPQMTMLYNSKLCCDQ